METALANQSPAAVRRRLAVGLIVIGVTVALLVRLTVVVASHWRAEDRDGRGEVLSTRDPIGSTADVQRVLIMSVDGLRPDLLLRARTPRIRSLMERGSYSMWAQTTAVSITLPSHTSMLTGVRPEFHRIYWNGYIPEVYPAVPTIFEQAHLRSPRLTTGLVAGKTKFRTFGRGTALDFMEVYDDGRGSDLDVGLSASDMIRRHAPQVMFVHFGKVDGTGHAKGWGTPDQIAAIEKADAAVGLVLDAVDAVGFTERTLVILSADHGGQGKGHGANDARSRHIPWIAAGPGIRRNYDLTRDDKLTINTEDTFATACTLMNIPLPPYLDGKFVKEIVPPPPPPKDLLIDAPKGPATTQATSKPVERADDYDWDPPAYKWERQPIPPHHEPAK